MKNKCRIIYQDSSGSYTIEVNYWWLPFIWRRFSPFNSLIDAVLFAHKRSYIIENIYL